MPFEKAGLELVGWEGAAAGSAGHLAVPYGCCGGVASRVELNEAPISFSASFGHCAAGHKLLQRPTHPAAPSLGLSALVLAAASFGSCQKGAHKCPVVEEITPWFRRRGFAPRSAQEGGTTSPM